MKSFLSRSAIIATVLLIALVVFSAKPSIAETLFSPFQDPNQTNKELGEGSPSADPATLSGTVTESRVVPAGPATNYVATAYSLRGRTASGKMVARGLIAADPRVLPLGSRVRVEHPGYTGEYLVADTGGMIRGRRIDIWIPSAREAMRFGRRTVKLTILSLGGRRAKRTTRS
jgi:3D (Asp-Asp-Asp) domain-containing protein